MGNDNGSGNMTKGDWHDWTKNLSIFLAPLGIIYLTQVLGVLNSPTNVLELSDFIPNSFTLGGMALYIINGALDFLRKLQRVSN